MTRKFRPGALLALSVLLPACDSGTSPVAPADPKETSLTISAHPPEIPVDGTSEIRAVALHKASGTPVRTGTEIHFTTDLGTIDPIARTDSDDIAVATLHADGRDGSAKVRARSGAIKAEPDPLTVTIKPADPNLVATFTTDPMETRESLTIKFKYPDSGKATSWAWNFGDGDTSSDRNPLHKFPGPDHYRVSLTVSDGRTSDSTSKLLRIGAEAGFTFTPAGLKVTFKDDTSVPRPSAWKWHFGDGKESALEDPVHTYEKAGDYEVRLEIETLDAGSDSTTRVLRVEAPPVTPPEADFKAVPNGLTVIFTDESDNDPTSWEWDFGDGKGSSEQDPVHTYAAAGTYLVELTVRNAGGADSVRKFVEVN